MAHDESSRVPTPMWENPGMDERVQEHNRRLHMSGCTRVRGNEEHLIDTIPVGLENIQITPLRDEDTRDLFVYDPSRIEVKELKFGPKYTEESGGKSPRERMAELESQGYEELDGNIARMIYFRSLDLSEN